MEDVVAFSDPGGSLQIRAVEPFGAEGFVAVGTGPRGAAAWHAPDGMAWQRVADGAAFHTPGGAGMYAVDVTDSDIVAVGIGDSATLAAAWRSTDGKAWERTFESGVGDYGGGMTSVASTATVSVAVGLGLPDPNVEAWAGAAWTSSDRVTWVAQEDMTAISPVGLYDVAATGPGVIAVGGLGGPMIVSSSDGEQWTAAELPAAVTAETEWRALAVDSDGTIIAIGTAPGWMLSSSDGLTWSLIRCEATPAPTFSAIAAGPEGFVAVGSDSSGAVLWRSDDGAAWEAVSELPLPSGVTVTAIGLGMNRAVLAGSAEDGSSVVWVGPADGRGEHPAGDVTCETA